MANLLKMYGERNTNTNYMSKLIKANLQVVEVPGVVPPIIMKAQSLFPGKELVRDLYFRIGYRKTLGWKHARVNPPEQIKKYKTGASVSVFLTITKNPYSWLLSLYRRPYHQYYNDSPGFETFLQRKWKTVGRDNIKGDLESPIDLWNIKNRSYLSLDREKTMNTTTEKIFEYPEKIIHEISSRFGIEKRHETFIDHESSTKEKNKDGAYYRDYYLLEKWRDNLSAEAIAIINDKIDKELMDYFGYNFLV